MELKQYEDGNEAQILSLFETVFKRKMSEQYWYWRFRNNPAGKHMITLMWDGDQLAGHYAVAPVQISVDGKKILTALSMTTMTHPEYGRRGIFGNLASELYSWVHKDLDVKAVWGFPNNNSHYAFIKKLNWQNIGVAHEVSIKAERLAKFSADNCAIATEFTSEHEALLEKDLLQKRVHVVKDVNYLRWRYMDNPSQDYTIIEFRTDGILDSFMVAKKYKINLKENIINILEVGGGHKLEVLGNLLSFVSSHFEAPIRECTMWMSLFDERYLLLEKMGFIPSGNNTYLGFKPLGEGLDAMAYLNNWHYTFGDSDVY